MKRYKSYFNDVPVYEECFQEAIRWQYVIRDGKRVKKPTTDIEGAKITYVDGRPKEVRMTGSEKTTQSRKNIKSARKSKGKKQSTQRKIKRSTLKHTW